MKLSAAAAKKHLDDQISSGQRLSAEDVIAYIKAIAEECGIATDDEEHSE